LTLFRFERFEAAHQRLKALAALARGQRIDILAGRIESVRHVFERDRLDAARFVQRAIAGDRRHPADRRAFGGVEIGGPFPNPHIGLLKDFSRQVPSLDDTNDHAIEFRLGQAIESGESGAIAAGDARDERREVLRVLFHAEVHARLSLSQVTTM